MSDSDSKYPSELAERFQVRLPEGMRDRIKAAAADNNRSMNAEIVATLAEKYPAPLSETEQEFIDFLASLTNEDVGALLEAIGRARAIGGDKGLEDIREYVVNQPWYKPPQAKPKPTGFGDALAEGEKKSSEKADPAGGSADALSPKPKGRKSRFPPGDPKNWIGGKPSSDAPED